MAVEAEMDLTKFISQWMMRSLEGREAISLVERIIVQHCSSRLLLRSEVC